MTARRTIFASLLVLLAFAACKGSGRPSRPPAGPKEATTETAGTAAAAVPKNPNPELQALADVLIPMSKVEENLHGALVCDNLDAIVALINNIQRAPAGVAQEDWESAISELSSGHEAYIHCAEDGSANGVLADMLTYFDKVVALYPTDQRPAPPTKPAPELTWIEQLQAAEILKAIDAALGPIWKAKPEVAVKKACKVHKKLTDTIAVLDPALPPKGSSRDAWRVNVHSVQRANEELCSCLGNDECQYDAPSQFEAVRSGLRNLARLTLGETVDP